MISRQVPVGSRPLAFCVVSRIPDSRLLGHSCGAAVPYRRIAKQNGSHDGLRHMFVLEKVAGKIQVPMKKIGLFARVP